MKAAAARGKLRYSRPLESLALSNMQHALVTTSGSPAIADELAGFFEPKEWEAAKHDDISLQEVRRSGGRSDSIPREER